MDTDVTAVRMTGSQYESTDHLSLYCLVYAIPVRALNYFLQEWKLTTFEFGFFSLLGGRFIAVGCLVLPILFPRDDSSGSA